MQRLWGRLRIRNANRRSFQPPVIPAAPQLPRTVMAFSDGQTCVAIVKGERDDGSIDNERELRVSFRVRTRTRKGRWLGVLELSAEGYRSLKDLVDEAEEQLGALGAEAD